MLYQSVPLVQSVPLTTSVPVASSVMLTQDPYQQVILQQDPYQQVILQQDPYQQVVMPQQQVQVINYQPVAPAASPMLQRQKTAPFGSRLPNIANYQRSGFKNFGAGGVGRSYL